MRNCKLVSDVGLKTDFILSFNIVLVFSLLYIGLLIMDDDEPDRMMMIMLTMIETITITLIQSSTIHILSYSAE